jgi:hypothetical protein
MEDEEKPSGKKCNISIEAENDSNENKEYCR